MEENCQAEDCRALTELWTDAVACFHRGGDVSAFKEQLSDALGKIWRNNTEIIAHLFEIVHPALLMRPHQFRPLEMLADGIHRIHREGYEFNWEKNKYDIPLRFCAAAAGCRRILTEIPPPDQPLPSPLSFAHCLAVGGLADLLASEPYADAFMVVLHDRLHAYTVPDVCSSPPTLLACLPTYTELEVLVVGARRGWLGEFPQELVEKYRDQLIVSAGRDATGSSLAILRKLGADQTALAAAAALAGHAPAPARSAMLGSRVTGDRVSAQVQPTRQEVLCAAVGCSNAQAVVAAAAAVGAGVVGEAVGALVIAEAERQFNTVSCEILQALLNELPNLDLITTPVLAIAEASGRTDLAQILRDAGLVEGLASIENHLLTHATAIKSFIATGKVDLTVSGPVDDAGRSPTDWVRAVQETENII